MNIKDIKILTYNSLFGSRLVAYFLSGCNKQTIKYELIFFLIPFVLKEESRAILNNANSKSTLYSLFLNNSKGKISLGGLEIRFKHFQPLTQSSIIVAAKYYDLKVNDTISIISPLDYNNEDIPLLKEYFRASYYLGKILSANDVFDTYLKLGIKEI